LLSPLFELLLPIASTVPYTDFQQLWIILAFLGDSSQQKKSATANMGWWPDFPASDFKFILAFE